jgi:membrane protein YqaA with SNARE-associated domain
MTGPTLGLLVVLLGLSYATAVVPIGPPEAYVVALVMSGPGTPVWLVAVAVVAALGQTAGKVTVLLSVRGSLAHRPRWLTRLVPDRFIDAIRERADGHRGRLAGLVAVSAFAGLPPLAMLTPILGSTGMPTQLFAVTGFAGRFARFALLALAPAVLW